MSAFKCHF